jgi:serine/threonine protein kinase
MAKQPSQPAPDPPGPASSSPRASKVKEETDLAFAADEAAASASGDPADLAVTRVVEITPFETERRPLLDAPTASSILPSLEGDGLTLEDFRLLVKIGEGAMGAVYKGRQLSLDREVAVKVLFKHVARNAKLVERFYREARVTGQLDHPNIVQGFGVGEDKGWHYFAMEYVDGDSLQEWLTRLGNLSVPDALNVTLVCAGALQYAHDAKLVHRDIKPANILITRQGQVKLADLGMVKLRDEDMGLTQTGHGVGTPWYMPLEQARNAKETDCRCDIYALGCMLYCMLTGQPPFTQPTLVEVIQAKEIGTFPPARQTNAEVPERLDLIIAKMVHKHARYRYASCTELIKDLESLGLASKRLGFLAPQTEPAARPAAGLSTKVPPPKTPPGVRPAPVPAQEEAADVWYVRYRISGGRLVQRKMTTAQVRAMIEAPDFDQEATASRTKEGFRALATYREFEPAVLGRVSKTGLDQQTTKYRAMYKKIEEEDRQRRRVEDDSATSTATYWGSIFLRVALAAGAVGLGYVAFRFLVDNLKGVFF